MTESLDRQIVAALCRDGRADVRSLADETDAVATTVQKHLRALESDGVIGGYAARVNYGQVGYRTTIVRLSVDLDAVEGVLKRLGKRREFLTVYETTGEFNVFAVGKFGSEAAVADCLYTLHEDPDVEAIETCSVSSVTTEGGSPLLG